MVNFIDKIIEIIMFNLMSTFKTERIIMDRVGITSRKLKLKISAIEFTI